nr:ATP synthase F0 subunit 6 [Cupuladria biporosa]
MNQRIPMKPYGIKMPYKVLDNAHIKPYKLFLMPCKNFKYFTNQWTGYFAGSLTKQEMKEKMNTSQSKMLAGSTSSLSTLFALLLWINGAGLFPYWFSATSHMAITFSMALPLWMAIIMTSMQYNLIEFLKHLKPAGAPKVMSPFLFLVEVVSTLIRPVTLAIRLAANLTTGHIVMTLMANGSSTNNFTMLIMMILMTFYLLFEAMISTIQSYIFTLLPTIYLNEHPIKE